ncbi:MAG: orotidine-5'-phosphate decarboxylase, partial [Acidimicrobiales bacterium]
MATRTFAERFEVARTRFGPLVFGLDPSASVLASWGLDDDAGGLERFADITLEATVGAVGMVKPQAAFFERHGWRGMKVLDRLVRSARSSGLLVILDAKRGDVGSTNDAYACAYLGEGAAMQVDALTLSPYLGVEAMGAFFDAALAAGSALFVVARSSNLEGRALQEAILSRPAAAGSAGEVSPVGAAGPAPAVGGLTVEQSVLASIAARNQQVAPGGVGPFGAVIGATHQAAGELDLVRMGGLL